MGLIYLWKLTKKKLLSSWESLLKVSFMWSLPYILSMMLQLIILLQLKIGFKTLLEGEKACHNTKLSVLEDFELVQAEFIINLVEDWARTILVALQMMEGLLGNLVFELFWLSHHVSWTIIGCKRKLGWGKSLRGFGSKKCLAEKARARVDT